MSFDNKIIMLLILAPTGFFLGLFFGSLWYYGSVSAALRRWFIAGSFYAPLVICLLAFAALWNAPFTNADGIAYMSWTLGISAFFPVSSSIIEIRKKLKANAKVKAVLQAQTDNFLLKCGTCSDHHEVLAEKIHQVQEYPHSYYKIRELIREECDSRSRVETNMRKDTRKAVIRTMLK